MTEGASIRQWMRTCAILAAALAGYIGTALIGTMVTGDAVAGAAISNIAALAIAIGYRWWVNRSPLAGPPQPRALRPSFWITVISALVVCWLLGQAAALWVYATIGSPQFDAITEAKVETSTGLLLLTTIVLAPIGEESLLRGVAYPALRRHWPPLASAFVTAMVFALLHANVVQLVLTVPLGLLLAFVYEATQRIWPAILLHAAFNVASVSVAPDLVSDLADPVMIASFALALAILMFAMTPGRYPAQAENDTESVS